MKKFGRKTALILAIAFIPGALAACSRGADIQPARATQADGQPGPSLAQFTDIPIPAGATMDVPRSLLLGPRDFWIGRLVFRASPRTQDTFEFYAREMPAFGWQEITRVRAETSVLTYTRDGRAATIQISTTTWGGSEVSLTVSPQAQPAMPGMGTGAGGVQSAPLN